MNPHIAYTLGMAGAAAAAAVVVVLAAAPTTAAADDITMDTARFISTTERGDVRADLLKRPSSIPLEARKYPKSTYTTAEARQGYLTSRDEVRALNAEDSGSSYLKMRKPVDPTRMMGAPAQ